MFLLHTLISCAITSASVGQDALTTRLLGQDSMRVKSELVDCDNAQRNTTLSCKFNVSGGSADIRMRLSAVANLDGSRAIIGYDITFANFVDRDKALQVLQPILLYLEGAYPKHSQSDNGSSSSFVFFDPKWAATQVIFVSSGLDNVITLHTKALIPATPEPVE